MTNTQPTLITRDELTGGANTHFCWNGPPNTYHPPELIADQIISWGLRYIRERWFPNNKNQQTAFKRLVTNGVGLYITIGAMDSSLDDIDRDMATLKASPLLDSVIGICGPNEPNKSENDTWHNKLAKVQQRIWNQRPPGVPVAAGALKVNVKTYEDDWRKIATTGTISYCDWLDFHNYPNAKGPIDNTQVAARLAEAGGGLPLFQSETGWTTAQGWTTQQQSHWVAETILRNSLDQNITGTTIYEALDNPQEEGKHSGNFGPDWTPTTALLDGPDHGQPFPGWIAAWQDGQPYDGQAICTSDSDNGWTLYLLAAANSPQQDFTLVLPAGSSCSLGEPTRTGDDGRLRWVDKPISSSMTVIQVSR